MNPHHHNGKLLLDVIQFRVESKRYSQIRAILAEASGESDTDLRVILKTKHGVIFGQLDDPKVFYVVSSEQLAYMRDHGVANPTNLQILMSTQIFDLDKDRAAERFRRLVGEDDDKRKIIELPGG